MKRNRVKTYMDTLMEDEGFKKAFEEEYENLCISEQIAQLRHSAHLTQEALAERIHTTKSAISRYENSNYRSYSINLLKRIAHACGAELDVVFKRKSA